jgi:hypothetical protein
MSKTGAIDGPYSPNGRTLGRLQKKKSPPSREREPAALSGALRREAEEDRAR